jgi:YqaJ-like viral recombinase domain
MIGDIDNGKDQWYADRWGKFTASEIHKLLAKGSGTEMFGVGARTYIKKKAIEKETVFWENPRLEFAKPLLWGKRYEEPAYERYVKVTGNTSMRYMGTDSPIFLTYNKDSGGSPDGLLGEGEAIHLGLELKCPEQSATHWDHLGLKDQFDLREYTIEYYAQIQFLLMITKAPCFHFVSFDERFKDKSKRLHIIEVFPEKTFQAGLNIRILQAAKERDKLIEEKNKR